MVPKSHITKHPVSTYKNQFFQEASASNQNVKGTPACVDPAQGLVIPSPPRCTGP